VRLHQVGKARNEDVVNVLDVAKTDAQIALSVHTVTKGGGRLAVLLFIVMMS